MAKQVNTRRLCASRQGKRTGVVDEYNIRHALRNETSEPRMVAAYISVIAIENLDDYRSHLFCQMPWINLVV